MSDTVIKVENLGKMYVIGHQVNGERYTALRDVATQGVKNAVKKAKDIFSGKSLIYGNEQEDFWALKDINFEIKQGEAVGIIGRNGAGKSTLLKVLSRITEPTKGRITLKGRVASLLEVGTGFHPELTGRENIFLNGAILGMSRAEIRRKFDEIVDFAGVEKFLDTPVKRFSSGMYVRLAFSVAAHLEPEILIVDEVLAVGDSEFQKKCLGKMDDIAQKEGRTVLFVSHNMGTIMQLCSKSILLNSGSIEKIGNTANVIGAYHSSASTVFVGKGTSKNSIFIKKVDTYNNSNENCTSFAHSESIRLRLTIGINKLENFQNIGIALLSRSKTNVFTVNKWIRECASEGKDEMTVDFIIPGELIAPMNYSFTVALNNRIGSITYEMHKDICDIKVYDDGTEFAFAEGYDYGSIILKDKWELIPC